MGLEKYCARWESPICLISSTRSVLSAIQPPFQWAENKRRRTFHLLFSLPSGKENPAVGFFSLSWNTEEAKWPWQFLLPAWNSIVSGTVWGKWTSFRSMYYLVSVIFFETFPATQIDAHWLFSRLDQYPWWCVDSRIDEIFPLLTLIHFNPHLSLPPS